LRSALKIRSKSQETINQTTRFLEKMLNGKDYNRFILIQLSPSITSPTPAISPVKISATLSALVSRTNLKNVSTTT
jgi:hypothetical protein